MDCCLCSAASGFRPPRNAICASCFEGARALINLGNRIEQEWKRCPELESHAPKGLMHAFKQMEHLELMEDEAAEKLEFLMSLGDAFREGLHTDLELVTNDGQSIHAHRIVLATKSPVFKAMFEVDVCKGEHSGAVAIHELNAEQLRCMLDFLYGAQLGEAMLSRHAAALLVAADKYDIPLLSKVCEAHLAAAVDSNNVLTMLELAALCSASGLQEAALKLVLKEHESIVFSPEYQEFAVKNSHVAVELTRALVRELKR